MRAEPVPEFGSPPRKVDRAAEPASGPGAHRLLDAVPQQVWTALPDGRLEYVNKEVIEYFGLPGSSLAGRAWDEWVHPDDRGALRAGWRDAHDSREEFEVEVRLRDGSGEHRWHLVRVRPQHLEGGQVVRWVGTNSNVHALKELERARDQAVRDLAGAMRLLSSERQALEDRAREFRTMALDLLRSNRELDQFAHVASHDLRAPLRGIAQLAEWLGEDLEGRLDTGTRRHLDLLQGRVQRMDKLIDGILQYSRAGRGRHPPERVDVADVVRDVVDILDPPERFLVSVDGYMPVLLSERAPLEQVFLNLVSNAIRHADGTAPEVRISVTDEGGGWYEFSVSDNGPGVAPEHHQRIFGIFQTLAAKDQVEGTGIGLAVVKRIVERQGGQAWVESSEGKGAAFRFLWPNEPRKRREKRAWELTR